MRKRINITAVAGVLVGMSAGYGLARYQARQANTSQLNTNIEQLSSYLTLAQIDLRESTANPTTAGERAYQANYKVQVAQAFSVWESITPTLVQRGFSATNVYLVELGLNVVFQNILPPYGMNLKPTSPTVRRAQAWIALFAKDLYLAHPPSPSENTDYISLLKDNLASIARTYRSYKSDGNFQVPFQ